MALPPTASLGWRKTVTTNVRLSEFRNGNITELLRPLSVAPALISERRPPRNLTLRKSQLSHEQALGMDQLLTTAESYLRELHVERKEREAAREVFVRKQ
jgi:hypothetical protein